MPNTRRKINKISELRESKHSAIKEMQTHCVVSHEPLTVFLASREGEPEKRLRKYILSLIRDIEPDMKPFISVEKASVDYIKNKVRKQILKSDLFILLLNYAKNDKLPVWLIYELGISHAYHSGLIAILDKKIHTLAESGNVTDEEVKLVKDLIQVGYLKTNFSRQSKKSKAELSRDMYEAFSETYELSLPSRLQLG